MIVIDGWWIQKKGSHVFFRAYKIASYMLDCLAAKYTSARPPYSKRVSPLPNTSVS